jgi:flagellar hook-associated protein 3 FlgL
MQRSLAQLGERLADVSLQLSSGRQVLKPSQDPAATREILVARDGIAAMETREEVLQQARGLMTATDTALGEVHDLFHEARDIALTGANSALPEAGLEGLARVVEQLRERLIELANTKYVGRFLFAGTETQTRPFEESAGPGTPVNYLGNSDPVQFPVAPGRSEQATVTGDYLANMGGAADPALPDMFTALSNLATDLRAGDVAALGGDRLEEIDGLLEHALAVRGLVGGRARRAEAAERAAGDAVVRLRETLAEREAVDFAEGIVRLRSAETAYQAALVSVANLSQRQNLFDYIQQ